MKRRLLLASCAALALAPLPAVAQGMPTYDNAAFIRQGLVWMQQARDMKFQAEQLVATYNALAHATDVSQVAAALGGPVRTYMPEAGQVVDMFAGGGGMWGAAQRLLNMGRFADVGTETPWSREMQRRELVTANARAIAVAGLESAQASVLNLGSLIDRISGSQDVTEVSAVGGALQVEAQNISHHRAQIDQVRLLLATEDRTERQRDEQMRYESARRQFESLRPITSEFE